MCTLVVDVEENSSKTKVCYVYISCWWMFSERLLQCDTSWNTLLDRDVVGLSKKTLVSLFYPFYCTPDNLGAFHSHANDVLEATLVSGHDFGVARWGADAICSLQSGKTSWQQYSLWEHLHAAAPECYMYRMYEFTTITSTIQKKPFGTTFVGSANQPLPCADGTRARPMVSKLVEYMETWQ